MCCVLVSHISDIFRIAREITERKNLKLSVATVTQRINIILPSIKNRFRLLILPFSIPELHEEQFFSAFRKKIIFK